MAPFSTLRYRDLRWSLRRIDRLVQKYRRIGGNNVLCGGFCNLVRNVTEPKEGDVMSKPLFFKVALLGAAIAAPATVAIAQAWVPGSEIAGQTLQVQTRGITNTIYLAPDGTATITSPEGTSVPATWSAANNQLCLSANNAQECWPYTQPFQPGQQLALTSSCQQVSTFLAQSTNAPVQQRGGERG